MPLSQPVRLLILRALICAAVVVRFWISASSVGSSDVTTWLRFARAIDQGGLWNTYSSDALFNHPPLGALLVWFLYKIHLATSLDFPFLLRIPGICGDLLILSIIAFGSRLPTGTNTFAAIFLYGFAPVPVLISGYHGNLDSLVIALTFCGVWVIHSSERMFWGGVWVGLAASLKLPPLVLIPALLAATPRNRWLPFAVGCMLPLTSVFVGAACGGISFVSNVLQYQPPLDMWGFTAFLTAALQSWGTQIPGYPHVLATLFSYPAKLLILGLPPLFLRLLRTSDIFFGSLLAFGAFLIFAPGFGPQYLIYPLPWLLFLNLRWAIRYLAAGSCALVCLYSWFFTAYPFASLHDSTAPLHVTFLYYLTWCSITAGVGASMREKFLERGH